MSDLQFYCDLLVEREKVFHSWTDSWIQGEITKALAKINAVPDGFFELWNGAVFGQFIQIQSPSLMKLSWKTIEFQDWMEPTEVKLEFQTRPNGSRLVVTHEKIPEPMLEQFRFAWQDIYLPQLQLYFVQNP